MTDPERWLAVKVSERAEEPDRALAEPGQGEGQQRRGTVASGGPLSDRAESRPGRPAEPLVPGSVSAAPPPEIAAIQERVRELLVAEPREARSVSWWFAAARAMARDADSLAAALERVTAERDEAQSLANAWQETCLNVGAEHKKQLDRAEAAEAERDRLREALRLARPYVMDAYNEADEAPAVQELIGSDMQMISAALAPGAAAAEPTGDPNVCANCGHGKVLHYPWCPDPYVPGKCNYQYDLCSCRDFKSGGAAAATPEPGE